MLLRYNKKCFLYILIFLFNFKIYAYDRPLSVLKNPDRVEGSLFHILLDEYYSPHYLNRINNSYSFNRLGKEKTQNIFEVALTGEGLYKIISVDPETNNNMCLTRTIQFRVVFKSCDEKFYHNAQKWKITKIKNENNSFDATITTKDKLCLFVQNFELRIGSFCKFKNSQTQAFTFMEYKINNNFFPYTHSYLLGGVENSKNVNIVNGGQDINAAKWNIFIGNFDYRGYQLTDLEGLKIYKPGFYVSKETDATQFYLTKSGNIYKIVEGGNILCFTASDVNEASWQHIGFRLCDKSLDKYQQWELTSISNKVNSGEKYPIRNLKLKNSDICLQMQHGGLYGSALYLSKCSNNADSNLLLIFSPVNHGEAFAPDLHLIYKPLKTFVEDEEYTVSPTNKGWAYLYPNSDWVFRFDLNSLRFVGYDRNNFTTNSVSCLRKNDVSNLFRIKTLNELTRNSYSYLEIAQCEISIRPEEQFLQILKPAKKGKTQFVIYSPLQKNEATTFINLIQNYQSLDFTDPNQMLCTGGKNKKYLWIGGCEKYVQNYWNDEVFFHWE